jgi:hypothetical protein
LLSSRLLTFLQQPLSGQHTHARSPLVSNVPQRSFANGVITKTGIEFDDRLSD